MSDGTLQHTSLYGIVDYTTALDTLCTIANRNLYLFEKDFDGLGFNSEARYESLRGFLRASPVNRLLVLAHDTRYLSTCPRMMMLLHQFGSSMFIHQMSASLHQITEPFAVADEAHYVRRFHFDDLRGILGRNDPENARALKSRFMEMWEVSHPSASTKRLEL